jgi:plastocyanin
MMRTKLKMGLVCGIVLAGAFVAGSLGRGLDSAAAATASVTINNFAFTPATTNINPGDTVTWSNIHAGVAHTVTSDTGVWDSGNIATSGTFSRAFPSAGSFPYHCTIHPGMTGMVVVAAAASPTAAAPTATPTTPTASATSTPTTTVTATSTATATATLAAATATATTPPATPTRTATQAATAAAASPTPAAPATGEGSGSSNDLPLFLALAIAGAGIVTVAAGGAIALRRRN